MKLLKIKGFTIIEMLVVIVIIGLLAIAVTVSLSRQRTNAKITQTNKDLKTFLNAFQTYEADCFALPPKGSDFYTTDDNDEDARQEWTDTILVELEGPSATTNWNGPYTSSSPVDDAWTHPFRYDKNQPSDDAPNGSTSVLRSSGPDGTSLTADDIIVRWLSP